MKTRNLHIPLPESHHKALRAEVARSGQPATELAREALRVLIEERQRKALHDEISAYAAATAGTRNDLDPDLEAAALKHLLEDDGEAS